MANPIDFLLSPWHYEFIRYSLIMGILIGIICPSVGIFLIVQKITLLGDVIAHSILPGLSLSFFLGIEPTIGAFISGLGGASAITWIRRQSRIKADSAMALTFSSFFALGLIIISKLKNKVDLDSFLFGDILSVTTFDIARTVVIMIVILSAIVFFYKELLFYTFDRLGAQAMGLPVEKIHLLSMMAVTLTIIASMQAVGVILAIALLVGPALTAYLLVDRLHQTIFLGAAIGIFSSITGIYTSYYLNLPSGPTIALVSSSIFICTLQITEWKRN